MKIFILLLMVVGSVFASESIKCELTESSTLHYNEGYNPTDKFTGDVTHDMTQLSITLVNIDTKSPVIVGNAGTQELIQVGRLRNVIQWIEPKGSGLVNILTYYPDTKILYYSKQYGILQVSYSYVYAGKCVDYN